MMQDLQQQELERQYLDASQKVKQEEIDALNKMSIDRHAKERIHFE